MRFYAAILCSNFMQQEILTISGGLDSEDTWNAFEIAFIVAGRAAIYWAAPPLANVIVAKFAKDAVTIISLLLH